MKKAERGPVYNGDFIVDDKPFSVSTREQKRGKEAKIAVGFNSDHLISHMVKILIIRGMDNSSEE